MLDKEVLIYDFDGVICDSVEIKTAAFKELYKNYDYKIQSQVMDYHIRNSGISRFEKFRYYQTVLLKKELDEKEIKNLARKFKLLVKEKVTNASYIVGAREFIEMNSFKKQFVCTGTPETEIIEIIKEKKLINFFENIYGSPKSKIEIINIIIRKTNIKKNKCVFFGDAMTDYNAALSCKIPFIGIRNSHTTFPKGTVTIDNFKDLLQ